MGLLAMGAYQGRGTALKAVAMVVMVLASLCANYKVVMATNYKVGDNSGWTIMSYDSWVAGKTFRVLDTLEFIYTSAHNVVEVNSAEYQSCSQGNNQVYTNGDTTFNLTTTGAKYYICSVPTHCENGMKLSINVVAAAATSPTPTTPTTPSTTPTSNTTTPSPSNSSVVSLAPSLFTLGLIFGLTIFFFFSS